jgi:hypothetical protein
MVSLDTTSGAGGQLRGLPRWNIDLAVSRKVRFTERNSVTFSGQLFNAFNVVQFADPAVNLQSPQSWKQWPEFEVIGYRPHAVRQTQPGRGNRLAGHPVRGKG